MDDGGDDGFMQHIQQRVGRTLCNKYTLEKVLGVGGMAAVYRGSHRNGNRVAVKMLHTALSVSKEIRERFLREGYVANKVDHEGAVRVLDDDIAEDGAPFLVMELLDGETLEDYILIRGGTMAPGEVIPFVCQLLDVLAAAHEKGIVHRDIKPENVFITKKDKQLKILDFGIARLSDGTRQATRTGRVMGTPVYMAPEQARGETKKVDGQTDVWAAAATLFRALTGRYVHEAETPEMVAIFAATQDAKPIRDVLPGLDPQIAEIVDRGLASNKDERWKNAAEMAAALRALPVECLSSERASGRGAEKDTDATVPAPPTGSPVHEPAAHAATEVAPLPVEAPAASGSADASAIATEGESQLRPRGPSTTGGLASAGVRAASGDPPPAADARRGLPMALVVGVGLLLVGGGVFALVSSRGAGEAGTSAASTQASGASAATSASGLAPVPSNAAPSVIAIETATGAPSSPPSAAADAGPSPPAPTRATARPTPPAPQTAPAAGAKSAAPAASVCKPVKALTADGTAQWKMECNPR